MYALLFTKDIRSYYFAPLLSRKDHHMLLKNIRYDKVMVVILCDKCCLTREVFILSLLLSMYSPYSHCCSVQKRCQFQFQFQLGTIQEPHHLLYMLYAHAHQRGLKWFRLKSPRREQLPIESLSAHHFTIRQIDVKIFCRLKPDYISTVESLQIRYFSLFKEPHCDNSVLINR